MQSWRTFSHYERRVGLPLHHGMNRLDGGFAWVLGDAVKEPVAKK